jgi:hypothetical protein
MSFFGAKSSCLSRFFLQGSGQHRSIICFAWSGTRECGQILRRFHLNTGMYAPRIAEPKRFANRMLAQILRIENDR